MKKADETLMDTNEAAERLGISRRHAWWLVRDGKLPAQKIGRTYVIRASDLKLVENRPGPGRPPGAKGGVKKKSTTSTDESEGE
jgi:excisionase family DNA binding protein